MNVTPQYIGVPHSRKRSVFSRLRNWLWYGDKPSAIVSHPEPQAIGSYMRGRQIMGGIFHFEGHLVEAPGMSIWDIPKPSNAFEQELHRFTWIEDLAAVGDTESSGLAQDWALEWIDRYSNTLKPEWEPNIIGRRLVHMLSHAPLILVGLPQKKHDKIFRSVTRQARHLSKTWPKTQSGLPRVDALSGLIYAGISLEGKENLRRQGLEALGESLTDDVDNEGGIPNRNPEDLLKVFTLLGWVLTALNEEDHMLLDPILAAMERIVPTLRALRHVDGSLARFHGGGYGAAGVLDKALVTSGLRKSATSGQAMGFATLFHGRSSVIVDAAPPPRGFASAHAHASTLAFELTSGNHPIVVNCGSGHGFGLEWELACRATASHSTLSLENYASARIGQNVTKGHITFRPLIQGPKRVIQQKSMNRQASTLMMSHDGYMTSFGLTHLRQLSLSVNGNVLKGEDTLRALTRRDKVRFDRFLDQNALQGPLFNIRFHLHPETEARLDLGGRAVSVTLPNGEVWIFRSDDHYKPIIEPSVYMEKTRLKPRAAKQIVISARASGHVQSINWQMMKADVANAQITNIEAEFPSASGV